MTKPESPKTTKPMSATSTKRAMVNKPKTCFDDMLRARNESRIPKNISYKKLEIEESPDQKKKGRKQKEESP